MHAIQKKIVMDEDRNPIAVQIDYEDWLEIERLLEMREEEKFGAGRGRFRELLEKCSSSRRSAKTKSSSSRAVTPT